MIFVNSISDLEYYNSSTFYGCYGEPVFNPPDVLLQAPALTAIPFYFYVNICDIEGTFQEDGTSNFSIYVGTFLLGGNRYYFVNVRCDDYTSYMLSARCFTINLVIEDIDGNEIFNKWTQKYQIVTEDAPVFVSSILIDDNITLPCVAGSNPALCINGEQYVKFESRFDCYDAYTGEYYEEGDIVSGTAFTYRHISYLNARFRDIPTEVERIVSINNRTQKTSYTGRYLLSGKIAFPVWKMKEIQAMMRGNSLYIDDTQFQSEGGTLFKQLAGLPVGCVYMYSMEIPFHSDFEWQIFGCVPDCSSLATYYLFPSAFERVYDDAMRPIAYDTAGMLVYFESLVGTTSAEEISMFLPCPAEALFKVVGSAVLPKFLYINQPIASQRIFPKQLSVNETDFSSMCNGITNTNQVPTPDVTGEYDTEIQVDIPDVTGEEDVDANEYTPAITAAQDWNADLNYTNAVSYLGVVTLNLSMSTDTYTSPFTNMVLGYIDSEGIPSRDMIITSSDNGNMPPSSSLYISATDGSITYTGSATLISGNTYTVELFTIQYDL